MWPWRRKTGPAEARESPGWARLGRRLTSSASPCSPRAAAQLHPEDPKAQVALADAGRGPGAAQASLQLDRATVIAGRPGNPLVHGLCQPHTVASNAVSYT